MASHTKSQIQTLLNNPAFVDEAIRILGENQTPSELRAKSTHIHNDIGFSAAYGTTVASQRHMVQPVHASSSLSLASAPRPERRDGSLSHWHILPRTASLVATSAITAWRMHWHSATRLLSSTGNS